MKRKKNEPDLSYLRDITDKSNKSHSQQHNSALAKKAVFVLFALFLFLFHRYAPYPPKFIDPYDKSLLQTLFDLYFFVSNQVFGIVHEGGHGVCYILSCPQFITVLNGTLFQILFPAGIGYYYYRLGNRLAANIGVFFTGFTMHNTAWYVSTAHEGEILPASKSFLGVDAYHDFYYILNQFGILHYDGAVAGVVKLLAYALMLYAVIRFYWIAFVQGDSENQ